MPLEIKMPQLGESVTEGTVGRWLKQPGEAVARYEALLEVVTDKVDTEVPAPVAGTLVEILVPEGETVRVGTVIARFEASDGVAAAGEPASAVADQAPSETQEAGEPSSAEGSGDGHAQPGERAGYLSPVVARLVAEHELDVKQIAGSGQGGRVTKQDVLRYLEARGANGAQPTAPPAPPAQEQANVLIPAPESAGLAATPQVRPLTESPTPVTRNPAPESLPEDAELLPLTPMRRAIAEHMTRSVRVAPHVTTVMEVDLSGVIAHREANRAAFERQGVRLTYTPYFFQAVAAALQRFPALNGSFSEAGIVLNRRIHLGMAVALDEGLLVPVVRDADEKNLLGLARAVSDLAERARSRRLRPEETQGGTFTITNHGVSGSLFATPIINQPQSGILGVGAIVKRPMVVSQGGVDAIAIKPMCYLSLTFDHRVADGAVGDGFLAAVKEVLELSFEQA
jgi:2-oxoglutarate dehydrogenase E2 component (dihydrolipoamide succinyltransferase)